MLMFRCLDLERLDLRNSDQKMEVKSRSPKRLPVQQWTEPNVSRSDGVRVGGQEGWFETEKTAFGFLSTRVPMH